MFGTVVIAVLIWVTGASGGVWDSFVNGAGSILGYAEEAPFIDQKIHKHFVERDYPAQNWVCTTALRPNGEGLNDRLMFLRLFRYITGQNSQRKVMTMTVPVTTEYTFEANGTNIYTMCFYIEKSSQTNPPESIVQSVFIQKRAAMTVYTRTVGGYITREDQWIDEGAKLSGFLKNEGISVSLDHMYWVSYDTTIKFWNRRNEVWFAKDR